MPKYITTKFTTSEPFLKKGIEIFQVDLSGLIVSCLYDQMTQDHIEKYEVASIAEACEEHIRDQQFEGVPLVVDSDPVLIPENRWFTNEYYIKVHLKNEPRLSYYIMNPIPIWKEMWARDEEGHSVRKNVRTLPLTFKSAMKYIDYIEDCNACASMGY